MNYIIFTGTAGAGKDSIIDDLVSRAEAKWPGKVEKSWYYSTQDWGQKEVKGKKHISNEEFEAKLEKGEIIFPAENGGYKVGYPFEYQQGADVTVMNIKASAAREIKHKSASQGGKVFMVYMDAPQAQRIERIRYRDNQLLYEPVEEKVRLDVVTGGPEAHKDYDLIIENQDGNLEITKEQIWEKVEIFLNELLNGKK